MAFRKHTQCYNHLPGDKPFNQKDLVAVVLASSAPGLIAAIIGAIVSSFLLVGIAAALGFIAAILTVADEWLFHRLVCLTGVKCAVGKVKANPTDGGLGNFDNDQFFNVILMPHQQEQKPEDEDAFPANKIPEDDFQAEELLKKRIDDLPFGADLSEARELHCEAEGDFWVKMKEWVWLLAIILGATAAGATAAGAAAAGAGAAIGCAALSWLGPLGCLIGAILGAIIGWIIGAAVVAAIGAAILYGVLDIIFQTSKGDVEDANVGDKDLGPIREGDTVMVIGEHVYDGFHEGWHEFHPLMAVMKMDPAKDGPYLEWMPHFDEAVDVLPADTPDMPMEICNLTADDMRQGLNSAKFAARARFIRAKWCRMGREAFDPTVGAAQKEQKHRWTIHPAVDGCTDHQEPAPIP